ncbi:MAG: thiol protease/hemagglutinin PrtT [Bacteroidales bacterium]|nr:thiol protease/hemagglutinin PrtT [Bacteroidales bacterium]MDD3908160.1 thiol protease/hemagglutinin PrtT [Bacteroidales bacterium]MDD4712891.1 thiol protease/hemagglutinin PrtT [Bacteroidales bacterium]
MKAFRMILIATFISGINALLMASTTSKEEALQKAQQFYAVHVQKGLRSGVEFRLAYSDTNRDSGKVSTSDSVGFYVFNAGSNGGFVIVSGDDAVRPILAYSDEGSFPSENIPENVKNWLDYYHHEIQYAVTQASSQVYKTESSLGSTYSAVAPLLGKIKWNQLTPYNLLCPYDKKSSAETVVGCVALAMAQVMDYYKWPEKGTGSNAYYLTTLDTVATLVSANFGNTTYQWNKILDYYDQNATPEQDSAVATLAYHCGVACHMEYGTAASGGSSAYSNDAGTAMIKYFGYDPDLQMLTRSYYDLASWTEIMLNELDADRPILYGGSSVYGGHEFVCDGYDNDGFFHFNWGWGGSADGYYSISTLDPFSYDTGTSTLGFSQNQDMIIGIQKPDGINKENYEMCMAKKLTSNKTSINAISADVFNINFGYFNMGVNVFNGSVAAALYKDESFLKTISTENSVKHNSSYGYSSYDLNGLSLSGLTDGKYKLYLVYKPVGSNTWSKFRGNAMYNNNLDISISREKATVTVPAFKPDLVLTSAVQPIGNIYQNRTGRFSVSVKNKGAEYNSYMSVMIYSATNPAVSQYLDNVLAVIEKDDTKTLEIPGLIELAPGTYYAYALYDSTSDFDANGFKEVADSSFSPLPFTIYEEPDASALTLNKKISLNLRTNPVGASIEIVSDETVLQADIYNMNGQLLGRFKNSATLPAGNLDKGVYVLRVTTESGIKMIRFIK